MSGERFVDWKYSKVVKGKNIYHIQVLITGYFCTTLIKEYIITYDKQFEKPLAVKLLGWKYICAKYNVDNKITLHSTGGEERKLFLRNQDDENCVIIKNLAEQDYMFKA